LDLHGINILKNNKMKNTMKTLIITVMLITASALSFAQAPPHPNGGIGPGGGNTPVGGGAPIDGGLSVFLILGGIYAIKKSTVGLKTSNS
jgi:hypothetical protein